MTAPARIRQFDIERAIRAARKAAPDACVAILPNGRIEIMLATARADPPVDQAAEWSDDDV